MKLGSLKSLIKQVSTVVRRFPVETFFALAGTCAATINVELKNVHPIESNWCIKVMMVSNLGLVLNLALNLHARTHNLSGTKRMLLCSLSLSIALLLLYLLNPMKREADYMRFIMISAAFHLLVSFVPFLGKNNQLQSFWQFNKTLFLRFLSGALFSVVLFLGLSAAIGSMNFLFNFDFEWDTYAILWVWIAGMFQTIFFLSGIPVNLSLLQEDTSYPKGLKIFTQYVLIPLATVYVIILLAYEVKILVEWNMPKGLVSSLILGYAVFGILSLLLVYPIRNNVENKWILTYSRTFYFLMVPLIILLCLAIIVRIGNYGITEERYFLIVLAIWLSFITLYFIFSEKQNILLIPLSLSVIILLSVYGPQSTFSVSRKSQLNELKALFKANGALRNPHINPLDASADSADSERVRNIVNYLIDSHGLESLQPAVTADLRVVTDSIEATLKKRSARYSLYEMREKQKRWVYNKYLVRSDGENLNAEGTSRRVIAEPAEYIPLNQADVLVNVNLNTDSIKGKIIPLNLQYKLKENRLEVNIGKDSASLSLDPMLEQLNKEAIKQHSSQSEKLSYAIETAAMVVPIQRLTERFSLKEYDVTFIFTSLHYIESPNRNALQAGSAILLFKKKK